MFILCKDTLLQATCCSQDSIAYIPAKCPGIKQFILDYYLRFGPGSCMERSLLQNHRVTKVLDLMGSLPHVLLTGVSSSPDLLGISKAQDTSISVGKCCNFPLIYGELVFSLTKALLWLILKPTDPETSTALLSPCLRAVSATSVTENS